MRREVAYVALTGIWCAGIVQALVNVLRPDWAPIVIDVLTGHPRRDREQAAATRWGQVVKKAGIQDLTPPTAQMSTAA